MLERVISGGQTGADQAAWRAARAAGIATSGWMPKGFRTETPDGKGWGERHPEFAELYGAREHTSSRYEDRTELNVRYADATLLIGDPGSPGSRLAYRCFREKIGEIGRGHRDPGIYTLRDGWIVTQQYPAYAVIPPGDMAGIIARMDPKILNICGNRESKSPGIGRFVEAYLAEVFRLLKGGAS